MFCMLSAAMLTSSCNVNRASEAQVSETEFKSLYNFSRQTTDPFISTQYIGIKEEKVIINSRYIESIFKKPKNRIFWAHKSEFAPEYINQIEAERIEKAKAHAR